jgi:hypothetical protein
MTDFSHRQNIRFTSANVQYISRIKKEGEDFSSTTRRIVAEHESLSATASRERGSFEINPMIKIELGKISQVMDHVAALLDVTKMVLASLDHIEQRVKRMEHEISSIREVTDMVKQQAGSSEGG